MNYQTYFSTTSGYCKNSLYT